MIIYRRKSFWMICLSFFVSLLLQVVPWPESVVIFQPSWTFLILLYWTLVFPHRVNIVMSFVIGIITDLINGSVLGINALAMSIVVFYFTVFKLHFFRNSLLWQQALTVTSLSFVKEIIIFFEEFLVIKSSFHPEVFWSSFANGMLWPWLFLLMNKIYYKFLK